MIIKQISNRTISTLVQGCNIFFLLVFQQQLHSRTWLADMFCIIFKIDPIIQNLIKQENLWSTDLDTAYFSLSSVCFYLLSAFTQFLHFGMSYVTEWHFGQFVKHFYKSTRNQHSRVKSEVTVNHFTQFDNQLTN